MSQRCSNLKAGKIVTVRSFSGVKSCRARRAEIRTSYSIGLRKLGVVSRPSAKWRVAFLCRLDARIVRGLIALVMAAYDGKTADQIQAFDIDDYFEQLGLIAHLNVVMA